MERGNICTSVTNPMIRGTDSTSVCCCCATGDESLAKIVPMEEDQPEPREEQPAPREEEPAVAEEPEAEAEAELDHGEEAVVEEADEEPPILAPIMAQSFAFTCPGCGAGLEATLDEGTSSVRCSKCDTNFAVKVERKQPPAAAPAERKPRPAVYKRKSELPPGWAMEERQSGTGKSHYKVFKGPNGEACQSNAAAWRIYKGEQSARRPGKRGRPRRDDASGVTASGGSAEGLPDTPEVTGAVPMVGAGNGGMVPVAPTCVPTAEATIPMIGVVVPTAAAHVQY